MVHMAAIRPLEATGQGVKATGQKVRLGVDRPPFHDIHRSTMYLYTNECYHYTAIDVYEPSRAWSSLLRSQATQ
jgi:hypothetical protein